MVEVLNEHQLLEKVIISRNEVAAAEAELNRKKRDMMESEDKLIDYLERKNLNGFKSDLLKASVEKREMLRVNINKIDGDKDDEEVMRQNDDIRERAFVYIDEELGRPDAIKITKNIHWKTLDKIIGDFIQKGEKYPEGLFKPFWQKKLIINVDS